MKCKISWHEEGAKNWKRTLESKKQELDRLKKEVKQDESALLFYELQIMKAKKQKKDGFDRDKFLRAGGK